MKRPSLQSLRTAKKKKTQIRRWLGPSPQSPAGGFLAGRRTQIPEEAGPVVSGKRLRDASLKGGRWRSAAGRRAGGAAWASLLYAPDGRSHVRKCL